MQDNININLIGVFHNNDDTINILNKEFEEFKIRYLYEDHEVQMIDYNISIFKYIPIYNYEFDKYIIYKFKEGKYNYSDYFNINPNIIYIFELQI
jgi:hypothetical protein